MFMFRLEIVVSSYIIMCIERNPSAVSLKMPSDSVVRVPMLLRIDVHILSMQFIRAMGLYMEGLWVSVLLGL